MGGVSSGSVTFLCDHDVNYLFAQSQGHYKTSLGKRSRASAVDISREARRICACVCGRLASFLGKRHQGLW